MLKAKIRISLERQTSSEKLSSCESMANSVLSVLEKYSESLRAKKIALFGRQYFERPWYTIA